MSASNKKVIQQNNNINSSKYSAAFPLHLFTYMTGENNTDSNAAKGK